MNKMIILLCVIIGILCPPLAIAVGVVVAICLLLWSVCAVIIFTLNLLKRILYGTTNAFVLVCRFAGMRRLSVATTPRLALPDAYTKPDNDAIAKRNAYLDRDSHYCAAYKAATYLD